MSLPHRTPDAALVGGARHTLAAPPQAFERRATATANYSTVQGTLVLKEGCLIVLRIVDDSRALNSYCNGMKTKTGNKTSDQHRRRNHPTACSFVIVTRTTSQA
jgi:hypothetical protein